MEKQLTKDERLLIKEIRTNLGDEINTLTEGYKARNITLKMTPKKTKTDNIIDMFVDGNCPDSIRQVLDLSYCEVIDVLNYNGLI